MSIFDLVTLNIPHPHICWLDRWACSPLSFIFSYWFLIFFPFFLLLKNEVLNEFCSTYFLFNTCRVSNISRWWGRMVCRVCWPHQYNLTGENPWKKWCKRTSEWSIFSEAIYYKQKMDGLLEYTFQAFPIFDVIAMAPSSPHQWDVHEWQKVCYSKKHYSLGPAQSPWYSVDLQNNDPEPLIKSQTNLNVVNIEYTLDFHPNELKLVSWATQDSSLRCW